jgi:hypothetical protein
LQVGAIRVSAEDQREARMEEQGSFCISRLDEEVRTQAHHLFEVCNRYNATIIQYSVHSRPN